MPGASTTIEIDVPAKIVYGVIIDFESYPEFLSEMRHVEVIHMNINSAQVDYEIKVIKTIRYTLDYELSLNKGISWSFVEGDGFKDCFGSWALEEKNGITEATYEVDVSFGLFVPKKITEMLVGKNLPNLMQAFKDRAESVA